MSTLFWLCRIKRHHIRDRRWNPSQNFHQRDGSTCYWRTWRTENLQNKCVIGFNWWNSNSSMVVCNFFPYSWTFVISENLQCCDQWAHPLWLCYVHCSVLYRNSASAYVNIWSILPITFICIGHIMHCDLFSHIHLDDITATKDYFLLSV